MQMQMLEWTMPNVYNIWIENRPKPVGLLPGVNQVEAKVWEQVKEHPNVKAHIDEGNLVVMEGPTGDRKKGSGGLKGYNVKEAKRLIKGTYDKELLAIWAKEDDRDTVVTEIEAQVKRVDESVRIKTDEEKNG